MDGKKFEMKIRDWAVGLGFRLPDGSAPPPNYFALLGVTPHRRQLWEVILESVHDRKKVELIRKQILAVKLKQGRGNIKSKDIKQVTDRLECWIKQNALVAEVKEKRKEVGELEKCILTRASDLLFDICKLSELEKQCEEYKEKVLVLQLFTRKEKKFIENLEKLLLKVIDVPSKDAFLDIQLQSTIQENVERSQESFNYLSYLSDVQSRINELTKSKLKEHCMWEEIVKCKKEIIEKFSAFLEELYSKDKSILSEKEAVIQKTLQTSITHLKQRITEKSLQIIINETESQILNMEVERMLGRVENSIFKNGEDPSFNDNISFLTQNETSESFLRQSESITKLRNYINYIGMKSYQNFLKTELSRLDSEYSKKQPQGKQTKDGEKELQDTLKSIEHICDDINLLKLELENQRKKIPLEHSKMENSIAQIRNEINDEKYITGVEKTAAMLKTACDKQVELFVGTPMDAFKTVHASGGRKLFACESLQHCLTNYGGELKQFFSAMLISPYQDVDAILNEIEKRKKMAEKVKKFISGRQHMLDLQTNCLTKLNSIKYDSKLCEKNFKDSDGIMWNILRKANGLGSSIEFNYKILKNWVEQPYRLMIKDTETVKGKTLREFEEQYSMDKNDVTVNCAR